MLQTKVKLLLFRIFIVSVCLSENGTTERFTFSDEFLNNHDLVDIHAADTSILIRMVYATTDNFMKRNLYGTFNRAYLRKVVAEKLVTAQKYLSEKHPGYHLLVYDALRPRRVQRQMWNTVKGTPQQSYVANPERGSIHNYGAAVDLTITDENRVPFDMGTPFDYFNGKAQPRYESYFIDSTKINDSNLTKNIKTKIRNDIRNSGLLNRNALRNRLLLRDIMKKADFIPIASEWWHFNAYSKEETRKRFSIIE